MEEREEERRIAFVLRMLHNQIKLTIHKSLPKAEKAPRTQLQGGILGYLYHHQDRPVYQRDIEKAFRISRATATNALQVMEREELIVRKALDKDGRLKRIQMTETAYRDHRRLEEHMQMTERRMLEGMSEEEVSQLRRLLGIMQKNLEDMTEGIEAEFGADGPGEGMGKEPWGVRKDEDYAERKRTVAETGEHLLDSCVQGKQGTAGPGGSCVQREAVAGRPEDSARAAPGGTGSGEGQGCGQKESAGGTGAPCE